MMVATADARAWGDADTYQIQGPDGHRRDIDRDRFDELVDAAMFLWGSVFIQKSVETPSPIADPREPSPHGVVACLIMADAVTVRTGGRRSGVTRI